MKQWLLISFPLLSRSLPSVLRLQCGKFIQKYSSHPAAACFFSKRQHHTTETELMQLFNTALKEMLLVNYKDDVMVGGMCDALLTLSVSLPSINTDWHELYN